MHQPPCSHTRKKSSVYPRDPYGNREAEIQAVKRVLNRAPAQILLVSLCNHHEEIVVTARIGTTPQTNSIMNPRRARTSVGGIMLLYSGWGFL
jgi:hypothetical protein